jgi:hypothetical protein
MYEIKENRDFSDTVCVKTEVAARAWLKARVGKNVFLVVTPSSLLLAVVHAGITKADPYDMAETVTSYFARSGAGVHELVYREADGRICADPGIPDPSYIPHKE